MSIKALSDYTTYSRYARYRPDKKRRETWKEQVDRVFDMYERKFANLLESNEEFRSEFNFAKTQVYKKRVLGSQRALQFGGAPIEKHNAKMYNCAFGYIDRMEAFQETMYLLLCGVGVGFSVQNKHIEHLPEFRSRVRNGKKRYVIEDSIEGWADSIGVMLSSYCANTKDATFPEYVGSAVEFDYSNIRPAGAQITGGFQAPGPAGLKASHEKLVELLDKATEQSNRLKPIQAYDIIMHMSDAVLSGGVRRSATICLFSPDDMEMINAKTGRWHIENPQRGRSNNSALLVRDKTSHKEFAEIMKRTKEFGEPGFIWSESEDIGFNPCCEIALYPQTVDGVSGFQFCNLTEGNGKFCKDRESFLQMCRASAIIGTLQASYTDFKYVSKATKQITEHESLLGCSITGMMDNPDILFDEKLQREGANGDQED